MTAVTVDVTPSEAQYNSDPAVLNQLQAAYTAFMQAKYPGESVEQAEFYFFDPNDNDPDWNKGLTFMKPTREYLLTPANKRGIVMLLKVARSARKFPVWPGWYVKFDKSWGWLGASYREVIALFGTLTVALKAHR